MWEPSDQHPFGSLAIPDDGTQSFAPRPHDRFAFIEDAKTSRPKSASPPSAGMFKDRNESGGWKSRFTTTRKPCHTPETIDRSIVLPVQSKPSSPRRVVKSRS